MTTNPPPFPTPSELNALLRSDASAEIARLRELVLKAFGTHVPAESARSVLTEGFGELAVQTVIGELEAAGWRVERGGMRDHPGELFVYPR